MFSPDGYWVGFQNAQGIYKVNTTGGAPVRIGPSPAATMTGSWGDDGYLYLAARQKVFRLAESGGEFEEVFEYKSTIALQNPEPLPDGRGLLLNSAAFGAAPERLLALDLQTLEIQDLDLLGSSPRYLANGVLVFAQGGQVMAVRFDDAALEVRGVPTPVLQTAWISDGQLNLDVSRNGTMAYLPASPDERASILLVDRQGDAQPIVPGPLPFAGCSDPRLSPDGKRLVMSVVGFRIWLLDLPTETPSLVSENGFYPLWSHDGQSLIFGSTRNESLDLFRIPADLSQPEELLLDWENNLRSAAMAPDGTLVFREEIPGKGMDLKIWPDEAEDSISGLLDGPDDELAPAISPDGRWVAYVSDLSSQDEIYVTGFPRPSGRVQVSNDGGTSPAWSVDGSELFYMAGDAMMAVKVESGPNLRVVSRERLFDGPYLQYRWFRQYDVHPDGQHFVIIENPPRGDYNVVTGWFGEVERILGEAE